MKTIDFNKVNPGLIQQENFTETYNKNSSPVKIILGLYKGRYLLLLKSVFFYILQISPTLVLPIVTANIINIASSPDKHSINLIYINAGIVAVLILQNIWSTYMSQHFRSLANRSMEYGMRSALASKLQRMCITFHKDMQAGRVQSKIMRDVDNIEGLCNNIFVTVISITFNLIVSISVTLSKSPLVFVFFLVTIPFAVFIMRVFMKRMRRANEAYRKDVESASTGILEMVELLPITKAHALEKTSMSRFKEKIAKLSGMGVILDKTNVLFAATNWVTFQTFQLICLLFTGILAYKKQIEIGDITLYQSYFATLIGTVNTIINLLPALSMGIESIRSAGEIMWSKNTENNEGKPCLEDVEGNFVFENIKFRYPNCDNFVLNDLNLTVNSGETIALVGESGSGKSTIVNMAIGFYKPNEGCVKIDGHNLNEIDLRSLRKHVAMVPQNNVLFAGTIRDNITYGLENWTEEELNQALEIANLKEMINKMPCGLDTIVGEHGDKLSGGQKQRVAIARAVIRKAKIVMFDEATSALDTVSEKLIQDAIEKLSKDRTTFIVAHRLSTIRNADKIAVIKNGHCVEYGTWEELMEQKGEFYKFKSLQS